MTLRGALEMGLTAGTVAALVLIAGWAVEQPGLGVSPAEAGAQGDDRPVDAFLHLDSDSDGVLNPREAQASWVLRGRFGDADANRDGSIDRSEFAAYELLREDPGPEEPEAAPPRDSGAPPARGGARAPAPGAQAPPGAPAPVTESLENAFRAADVNGDGRLSLSEFSAFRTAPAPGGESPDRQEGEPIISPSRSRAFEQLDRNGDQVIDYGEAAAVPALRRGFGDADTDLNAEIDQAEFSAFVLDLSLDPPELPGRAGEPITEVPAPLD